MESSLGSCRAQLRGAGPEAGVRVTGDVACSPHKPWGPSQGVGSRLPSLQTTQAEGSGPGQGVGPGLPCPQETTQAEGSGPGQGVGPRLPSLQTTQAEGSGPGQGVGPQLPSPALWRASFPAGDHEGRGRVVPLTTLLDSEKRRWAPLVGPWGSPGRYSSRTTTNIIST